MSDYIPRLRAQLVDAAAREQAGVRPARTPVLPRPRVLSLAGVAVALIAIAAAGLAALNLESDERVTRPDRMERRALVGGSLEPGVRYVTRSLGPQISFAVSDDRWFFRDGSNPWTLTIDRERGGEKAARSFLVFGSLPRSVTDPETGRELPAPRDLLGWLRDHPDIRVEGSGTTTVGGMPAVYLDTTVDFPPRGQSDPQCRRVFDDLQAPSSRSVQCMQFGRDFLFPRGVRTRWLVVATGDRRLPISIHGWPARNYERVLGPAERVLETLRVGR